MCASYGLQVKGRDIDSLDERLVTPDLMEWLRARENATIRPTGPKARNFNPVITAEGPEDSWWGMWVGNSPGKFSTINARSERLTQGLWKRPLEQGRALIPVARYFEYRDEGGPKKQRYAIHFQGEPLFWFAGLVAPIHGDGLPRTSYTMVTRPAAPSVEEIHDRMPVIVPAGFQAVWMDPATEGDQTLVDALLAASDQVVGELTYEAA